MMQGTFCTAHPNELHACGAADANTGYLGFLLFWLLLLQVVLQREGGQLRRLRRLSNFWPKGAQVDMEL